MDVAATLITELRKSGKPVPPDMSSSDIVKVIISFFKNKNAYPP